MGLESNIARTSDSQTGTQQYTRPLVDMSDPTNFNKKLDTSKIDTSNTPILVAHGGEDHGTGSEVKPDTTQKKPTDSLKSNSGSTEQGDRKPDATPTATDKPSQPTVGDNTSGKVDIHRLPNGDGHVVTKAEDLKPGEVLVSPKAYEQMKNGQTGAVAEGAWINPDGTYDLTKKIKVSGEVVHSGKYQVTSNAANDTMTITGNTLPSTTTGKYPIDRNSDAAKIDPNPNGIQANDYTLTIPKNPKPADQPSPVGHGAIAVMTNGGLLFSTLDGKGKDANKYEVQDNNVGHPSEAQHYHAHKVPPVLYEKQDKTGPSPVLGRALDGYPIVAAYKANGELYSTKELDKFHGREVEVKQEDGTVKKQWAYCVSLDYPYTIGAFKGTPSKIEGLREPSPPQGKPGDGGPPAGKPGDGKPADKQNDLPSLDIADERRSGKNGEQKTARLETTLYDIAKKSLSEINQNNGQASSDSIYRELNRIMALNGYQSANLDGKQNITDRNLPSAWNNVSKNQEFKLFDGGSNSHKNKAKPVADPASTTGDPLRLPTGVIA